MTLSPLIGEICEICGSNFVIRGLQLHHFLDSFLDQSWAVGGGCPESEEGKGRFLKEVIEQLISEAPVGALMGRIVQLNGGNRMKICCFSQNEIHMFTGD